MPTRRNFLALLAPNTKPAFQGKLLAASYDLRTRATAIYFLSNFGPRAARFSHDTSLVSLPVTTTVPDIQPARPKIMLRREAGWLNSYSSNRKLSSLMVLAGDETLEVLYPNPVHPDLVALWTVNGRMFFTNNDYRNVYELPQKMSADWQKPLLFPNSR